MYLASGVFFALPMAQRVSRICSASLVLARRKILATCLAVRGDRLSESAMLTAFARSASVAGQGSFPFF